MFGSTNRGAQAYANVGVETGVRAASPHKLIVMLFEGAMMAISSAQQHMKAGNIPEKGRAISHAIAIVDNGLRASLDRNVGGDIAINLDALYLYISQRLLLANLNNDEAILQEVYRLLKELKEAWESISAEPVSVAAEMPAPALRDPLAPKKSSLVKA